MVSIPSFVESGFPLRYVARGGGGSADCLAFLPSFDSCSEQSGLHLVRLLGYFLHARLAIAAYYRRSSAACGNSLHGHERGASLVKNAAAFALHHPHNCSFDTSAAFRRSPVVFASENRLTDQFGYCRFSVFVVVGEHLRVFELQLLDTENNTGAVFRVPPSELIMSGTDVRFNSGDDAAARANTGVLFRQLLRVFVT
jgi:hypothetical protein